MLAVATNISAGGVALVFLANQVPGLLVKLSAPYWFHLISYKTRILMASIAMSIACFLVGCGGLFRDELAEEGGGEELSDKSRQQWGLALELFGVSFVSFSCSLGEASLLALAGKFDSVILPGLTSVDSKMNVKELNAAGLSMSKSPRIPRRRRLASLAEGGDATNNSTMQQNNDDAESIFAEESDLNGNSNEMNPEENNDGKLMKQGGIQGRRSITAYASGTGLAGVVGYGYKALLSDLFGWGLSATIWSAGLFAFVYFFIFLRGLHKLEQSVQQGEGRDGSMNGMTESSQLVNSRNEDDAASSALEMTYTEEIHDNRISELETMARTNASNPTPFERFRLVLSLWRYTIPLFTVYASEYMLQAGVWSAMGFPVTSASARAQFYHYSNWTYQAGVFLSRSSGNLCTASLQILWLMPLLQMVNLYFFWMNSMHHFWDNFGLLLLCFFAGLLGGGVYVQGFSRINADMPVELREFAIASASVADSLGILTADILSLFIQSCIYKENHLEGAVVQCPY